MFIDSDKHEYIQIVNDKEELQKLYEANKFNIWVGFNNKHYDQYVFKGILLGMNPKEINDWIIMQGEEGWAFSRAFNKIPMINYDTMPSDLVSLKTLEGFMGSDIRETEVDFNLDRNLTQEEIEQTLYYCTHDVEQTIQVFMHTISNFQAAYGIINAYPDMVGLFNIGDTEAKLTAKVLGCQKKSFDDEFDYFLLPCLRIKKYACVVDWFKNAAADCTAEMKEKYANAKPSEKNKYDWNDEYRWSRYFYSRSLTMNVAGIPHTFGFGGLHGATAEPVHIKGALYHVDVNNYYPSMLLAWDLVTRAATNDNYDHVYKTRKEMKYKQRHAKTKEESKKWKKAQLPYKKMLNALSGAMKDKGNPAYDPRNNNIMCINGQLMLLDLIEHLEVIPGFKLIQSNTDGLIVWLPDTDEAFEMMDDICYEWEQRCSTDKCQILLELDCISEIYQKDVNNYLWIEADDSVTRIGAYLKELSPIDYDLPILNEAVVNYMVHKKPVEDTINECDELIKFQKVVKLSSKYDYVEHECGQPIEVKTGVRVIKTHLEYTQTKKSTNKSYRVFASNDITDGRLLKRKKLKTKSEKFGNTPEHCFIFNEAMEGVKVPAKLDKQWYINKAKERLGDFGVYV